MKFYYRLSFIRTSSRTESFHEKERVEQRYIISRRNRYLSLFSTRNLHDRRFRIKVMVSKANGRCIGLAPSFIRHSAQHAYAREFINDERVIDDEFVVSSRNALRIPFGRFLKHGETRLFKLLSEEDWQCWMDVIAGCPYARSCAPSNDRNPLIIYHPAVLHSRCSPEYLTRFLEAIPTLLSLSTRISWTIYNLERKCLREEGAKNTTPDLLIENYAILWLHSYYGSRWRWASNDSTRVVVDLPRSMTRPAERTVIWSIIGINCSPVYY